MHGVVLPVKKLLALLLAAFVGCAQAQIRGQFAYPPASGAGGITSGTTATSGCTAGGVLFSSSNTVACADTDLTFNGDVLSAKGLTVTNAPTFSALTQYRIPVAGTAGLLGDFSGLVWGASGTAGRGLDIAAGTATTDVPALSLTRTNNNAAVATGVLWTFTDTSSAATFKPVQILGGASGTTDLLSLSKEGYLSTQAKEAIRWSGNNLQMGVGGTGIILPSAVHLSTANVVLSGTAPSIASGFGTSPSRGQYNGTAAFKIDVGTGGTASSGVVTMPAAAQGWNCKVTPDGAPQAAAVTYSAPTSTTSITLTNYTIATGAALAWTASTVLAVSCMGY